MAKEHLEQQAAEPREQGQEPRTPRPRPEPAAPLLNEGLERVRESHC